MTKGQRTAVQLGELLFVLLTAAGTIGSFFLKFALRPAKGRKRRQGAALKTKTDLLYWKKIIAENEWELTKQTEQWLRQEKLRRWRTVSREGYRLSALCSQNESSRWVIIVHGYGEEKINMLNYACQYAKQGYRVLLPDLRSHGESEGKFIGMGWEDRLDLLHWIFVILKQDNNAVIALHGHSMGGATVLMAAGELLPKQVKAVVSDCAYTSAMQMFEKQLREWFGLSPFPILSFANAMLCLSGGYNLRKASVLEKVKKSTVPILFIHGDRDSFVPTQMVYQLYKAASCEKELLVMKGAAHTESQYANPEKYYQKIYSFLEKHMK